MLCLLTVNCWMSRLAAPGSYIPDDLKVQYLHAICPEWILKVVMCVIGHLGRERPDQTVTVKSVDWMKLQKLLCEICMFWIGTVLADNQWKKTKQNTSLQNCCVSFTVRLKWQREMFARVSSNRQYCDTWNANNDDSVVLTYPGRN